MNNKAKLHTDPVLSNPAAFDDDLHFLYPRPFYIGERFVSPIETFVDRVLEAAR